MKMVRSRIPFQTKLFFKPLFIKSKSYLNIYSPEIGSMGLLSSKVKKMVGVKSGRIEKNWSYNSNAALLAPPLVADINNDGTSEIVIGTKEGDLLAIDANAQLLWKYSINEAVSDVDQMFMDQEIINSINSEPVVAPINPNGTPCILFGTELGFLYCLNTQGQLLWKFQCEGAIRGSVLIADVDMDGNAEIIFGSTDKHVYILNNQGKLIERFEQSAPIQSTPGFFDGQIVVGLTDGNLVSLTTKGEQKWVFKTGGMITATPAFEKLSSTAEHVVIIGSTDNNLYCLDINGELIWTYETKGAIYSKATLVDINNDGKLEILVGSCDNNVHAVTDKGQKLWTYETDFWVVSSPVAFDIDNDGKLEIIVGSYDHNIYVLDSKGSFVFDYVPGLSGVVHQPGHYSDVITKDPGEQVGKKIWQFKTDGVVIGCAKLSDGRSIVVGTKKGMINGLSHKE